VNRLMLGGFSISGLLMHAQNETKGHASMKSIPNQPISEPALFQGFPYILTHFTGRLYHVILLPQTNRHQALHQIQTVRYQAESNKLPTWLVLSDNRALFFDIAACNPASVPRPGAIAFGNLVTREVIPETGEILTRYLALNLHADHLHGSGPAFYVGNLAKGGRPASAAEIERLNGRQSNGVPKGLRRCATCREWIGACLDTTIPRLFVNVHCRCRNENRCARCGQLLYDRKLNANYFSEEDGGIWHVPGFCATSHKCPQAVESWVT
jgi:hypothetical protein